MKNYFKVSVLQAAKERIKIIFDSFDKIYISFSGGKDSGVMFHLMMDEAIKRKRKIGVLFVDLEGQYQITIDYINKMFVLYKHHINIYWVCLPISLRNATSVYEPKWICWDDEKKDFWVRQLPKNTIHNDDFFPFFKKGMEFEDFIVDFGRWYSLGEKTACFVGIRTDESLNRYRTITNKKKETFKSYQWTTKIYKTNIYNVYPIYDWKTKDIWIYNSRFKKSYNKLYDLMHKAGLTIHQQRICQPYGDDQRKGLWLFQIIEPETWSKLIPRVNGANSGAEFVQFNGNASGQIKITKPKNHNWESFSKLLLATMPEISKEHYSNKIHVYLNWYEKRGWTDHNGLKTVSRKIPDENMLGKETKNVPSWKRICKMLLRNDYWAKGLSFSQTKTGFFYKRYMSRIKKDREKRKFENLPIYKQIMLKVKK
jgi:predicted phosphoadenosine phosphosulfate sulfurtransferase